MKKKYSTFLVLGLIIVIIIATLLTIAIRQQQKSEINKAIAMLNEKNTLIEQIETTLEILFIAENDFKSYTLNYDITHLQNYREKIKLLVDNIDSLQQMINTGNTNSDDSKAYDIIKKKNDEAKEYVKLKMLIDSLLVASTGKDVQIFDYSNQFPIIKDFSLEDRGIEIDTIKQIQTTTQETKGVFGKIKKFFVGEKKEEQSKIDIIVRKGEVEKQEDTNMMISQPEIVINTILEESNKYYQEQFRKLFLKQSELRKKEIKLIQLNSFLMQEIKTILGRIKTDAIAEEDLYKNYSSGILVRSIDSLHIMFMIAILLAIAMAVGLFASFRKMYRYQQEILSSKKEIEKQAVEKDRFLAYISHEFRTPLSSIIGFGRELKKTELNPDQSKFISGVLSSSEIMLTSVNDILDLSRLQAGKMNFISEPFQPVNTIQQAVDSFSVMAQDKHLELNFKAEKENIILLGDEIRLLQIVNNLLSNALKYTKKGSVTVILSLIKQADSMCIVQLQVADTGMGIEADKINSIFDEYSRVHSEKEHKWIVGTGLGLSVTNTMVEKMGGKIHVESQLSKGSVFTVTIPFLIAHQKRNETPISQHSYDFLKDKHILIADDNYFNVSLLKLIFDKTEAQIYTVENGEEALNKIEKWPIDILITDMYMPLMDGLTLAKKIRLHNDRKIRKLAVIMLTGNISSDVAEQIAQAGINKYLHKPFKPEDLFDMIYQCLFVDKEERQ